MENDGSGENTDELLSADVDDEVDVYGLIPVALSHDHCDVLLDAMDAQLSHLQIHSQSQMHGGKSKRYEFPFSGYLDRSQSVSKDTGLGSSAPTNDKTSSNPDWTPSEHQTMEIMKVGASVPDVWCPEGDDSLSSVSRVEQCRWRLERLLGRSAEAAGIGNEEDEFTMDSVCTEDFSTRFREEMLVLPASAPITSSDTADLTEERSKSQPQHPARTPIRHMAGMPLQSFDSVTIDTDLDTVCSEQVRQHLKSTLSNRTVTHFAKYANSDQEYNPKYALHLSKENGFCTGQTIQNNIQSFSSDDERTVEETSSEGAVSKLYYRSRRHSSGKKGKRRSLCRSRRNDSHISTERARDKSRIDGNQLKELRMSLTELLQQKTATLHTLENLREEMDEAKREKLSLQISVRDSRAQAQNITYELHRLQAQRDSCLEERLDEVNQELEQREEDYRTLHQKCSDLEKQLADMIREKEQIKESTQEDLEQQVKRFAALERIVAQKELLLQGAEEAKKALLLELCSLREEHSLKLREIQNRTKKDMEQQIEQLTLQLTKSHKEELQKVHQQADELRSAALNEQAQTHKQSLDSLHNCIQMKDEEVKRLKEALEQHEEKMTRQAEELRRKTQEKIQKAVKREERKWEEQREKALREQRGTLEQQIEEAAERWRAEVEKERRNALVLQSKVIELQKEAEKEAVRLKKTLQRSEKELLELRTAITEKDQTHQRRTARHEQKSRRWAQDIHAECVCLQEFLEHNGLTIENKLSSGSPTVSETLQNLQSLTKALQQLINDLKMELNSQRRAALQLTREKVQELKLQKEQLMEEKERALAALKEKLIQEHIEEMSSLSRAQLRMDNDDTDRLCVHMRRQLQAKDDELRQPQNNMGPWKDKTTTRLAHKFELNAEQDRRVPKPRADQQKRLERLENEMRHLTGQCRDFNESHLASSALQGGTDFQNSRVTQDLTSYKLLQHLQSRIRQIQAERQTHCPVKWDREPRDLGGSYLDTIAPAQESYKTEDLLPAKSISS
ncbi:trichohyalin isoform X4 [Pimephales promelas]|uniref:trichohyalin isoform X4 n=1 Tax=Pimephales promelas TaxID=90988 RepID=UPI0019555596|nr:trichohyalin isoform X4 [Pimephales promelas]KAG1958667.1 hypothetical protein F2P79_006729 [Pimephales promelas]KAG1958669.1 hypothetical protein F2P79_006729 [Pimephales promelas]KAG1958671.1 hypothetical protein F2P79_006729 [Pimephales promelas]